MSYEERHKISSAWIQALDWQCFHLRCGDLESATRWEQRANGLKIKLLVMESA